MLVQNLQKVLRDELRWIELLSLKGCIIKGGSIIGRTTSTLAQNTVLQIGHIASVPIICRSPLVKPIDLVV